MTGEPRSVMLTLEERRIIGVALNKLLRSSTTEARAADDEEQRDGHLARAAIARSLLHRFAQEDSFYD